MSFQINLRGPREPDVRFDQAVQFFQMCMQGDQTAGALVGSVSEHCSGLRRDFPGDPAIWHISAAISVFINNHECARYFLAKTILLGLDTVDTRGWLGDLLANDMVWRNVDSYLSLAGSSADLVNYYVELAHRHFSQGDLTSADILCQRVSALGNPALSQFDDIHTLNSETLASRAAGTLQAEYQAVVEGLRLLWSSRDSSNSDIEAQMKTYARVPDRQQFAEMVANRIQDAGNGHMTVLEIGCYAGGNLNEVRSRLSGDLKSRTKMIGIEPNASVVEAARALFSDIRFHVGDHDTLSSGEIDIPDQIDICMISRVLMVLMPEDVVRLLKYLSPRTRTLIICDDIFNMDGKLPVVRKPPNLYLMHAFRENLENTGFHIEDVRMAAVPDRECTGFIIANGTV